MIQISNTYYANIFYGMIIHNQKHGILKSIATFLQLIKPNKLKNGCWTIPNGKSQDTVFRTHRNSQS